MTLLPLLSQGPAMTGRWLLDNPFICRQLDCTAAQQPLLVWWRQ